MVNHLVMLHGFGCDSRVFQSIGTKLSKDHDVIMVDLPGHGQTKEQFRSFHYSAYQLLGALGIYLKEPFTLLGWSMGGQIALEMYKQKPELIRSLVLISSTPKFVASDDFEQGMNEAVFSKFKKGLKNDPKRTMDDFYSLMFAEKEEAGKYLPSLITQTPSLTTLNECMESFEKFDERDILEDVNVPALILTGDSDKIVDMKASEYMSGKAKNSILKIFKGAGHAPHLTREEEVIDELTGFLG